MKIKIWIFFAVLLLGLVLGVSIPTLAPKYFQPYLPQSIQKNQANVEGIVVRKQHEPDRLLLTISSSEGAVLATFKKKVTEISLLIEEGDTVMLNARTYEPFVDDPTVMRVRKPNLTHPSPEAENSVELSPPPLVDEIGPDRPSDQPE